MALTGNPVFHSCTKHIDISHHFVRETVENCEVVLQYVRTIENWVDLLTKPLPAMVHNQHCKSLQLIAQSRDGEHTKVASVQTLT